MDPLEKMNAFLVKTKKSDEKKKEKKDKEKTGKHKKERKEKKESKSTKVSSKKLYLVLFGLYGRQHKFQTPTVTPKHV